jgi:hypothetical protein
MPVSKMHLSLSVQANLSEAAFSRSMPADALSKINNLVPKRL